MSYKINLLKDIRISLFFTGEIMRTDHPLKKSRFLTREINGYRFILKSENNILEFYEEEKEWIENAMDEMIDKGFLEAKVVFKSK